MATATQTILDRHDTYMVLNIARYPIAMVRGEGSRLFDAEGKRYLDLFAGFGAGLLGHCHPDLVAAVTEQAGKLWFQGGLFHNEPQTRAAEAISRAGFGGRSYFCHSGADANEAALKLARLYGREHPGSEGHRWHVITASRSFHGRSLLTMAATGQPAVREYFDPIPPGFAHVPYGDLAAIEAAITPLTVAIMLEPIQGEGGINVPADDFFPRLRKLCDERDILLICDEVWTGGGRTGKTFAYQHFGITPDIMTLAKGVGGGLPVGVMCAQQRIAQYFESSRYGRTVHATTLGGNCLSMAVAARIFEVLERDKLVEHAATLGRSLMDRLQRYAQKQPAIAAVRGKGLFVGIELQPGSETWFKSGKDVVNRCLEKGLLINATQGNVLRIAPAVTITADELSEGIDLLESVISG